MALTNLCSLGPELCEKIVKSNEGKDFNQIEMLQTSDDVQMRRAATELLCNLLQCNTMFERYESEPSYRRKLKLWMVLGLSEDTPTARASVGALAILSQDPKICKNIISKFKRLQNWSEWFQHEDQGIQHRAAALMNNMCDDKEWASRIASDTPTLQLMVALQAIADVPVVTELLVESLMKMVKHGLLEEGALKNFLQEAKQKGAEMKQTWAETRAKKRPAQEAEETHEQE